MEIQDFFVQRLNRQFQKYSAECAVRNSTEQSAAIAGYGQALSGSQLSVSASVVCLPSPPF